LPYYLLKFLRKNGVGAYNWPGDELPTIVSESEQYFPNAIRFNKVIVCLPVHEALKTHQIDRMVSLIK
jgi:dTDP-4-amino-4,6-dideoxygalactose transaminase